MTQHQKHHQKKQAKTSMHSIAEKIKKLSKKAWHATVKFEKTYGPKLKALIILGWNNLIAFIEIYWPKVKHAIVSFAYIYGRKSKEAFIAFRKNYEPKIKEQANILGNKTIDFAKELKKKMNKS